jgi:hypothetical protein
MSSAGDADPINTGTAQNIAQPLLYQDVSLIDGTALRLQKFLEGHHLSGMVTRRLRLPGPDQHLDEHSDDAAETIATTYTLLAMLPHLEEVHHIDGFLQMQQAMLLKNLSGDALSVLNIILRRSEKYIPETLAIIGELRGLRTLRIQISQGGQDHQIQRPILPITLPALHTMEYQVTCEGFLPWLNFLSQSSFPKLRTLILAAFRYDIDDGEHQSMSALRPFFEQHPRLQRLETRLGAKGTVALLAQPMSILELAVQILHSTDNLQALTLPPAITTLELKRYDFAGNAAVVRAVIAGLAAHGHGRLRSIRLSSSWSDRMLPLPDLARRNRLKPNVVAKFSQYELDYMQFPWLAQNLRAFGVELQDTDGKGIETGTHKYA